MRERRINGHICLYVDDLILTGSSEKMIQTFKDKLNSKFEMSDMGSLEYFLGLEIKQAPEDIFVCKHSVEEIQYARQQAYFYSSYALQQR